MPSRRLQSLVRLQAAAFLLFFTVWPLSDSQAGRRLDTEDFIIDVWETDDGLPESSATAMVQTPDGYLWFGTFYGLVRFDGVRFEVFNPANTPALPDPGIVNLHLDRQGRMWISTLKGLVVRQGSDWRAIGPADGWEGDYVRFFAETDSGELYLSSFNGKLLRVEGDRHEAINLPGRPGRGHCIAVDERGLLYAGDLGLIWRRDGKQWTSLAVEGATGNSLPFCRARQGGLWLVRGDALLRLRDGSVETFDRAPFPLQDLWDLVEDRQGTIWCSSFTAGLYVRWADGRWQQWKEGEEISYKSVRFVFQDREGTHWVGTSGGGLHRVKQRVFATYGVKAGLAERNARSVSVRPDGTLHVATFGQGVFELRGKPPLRALPGDSKRTSRFAQCVLDDRSGRTWVGDGGLWVQEAGEWREVIPSEASDKADVAALFEDSRGRVWAGTAKDVWRFDPGGALAATHPFATPLPGVRYITEAPPDGEIFLCAGSMVHQWDGKTLTKVPGWPEQAPAEPVSLHIETDRTLWVGTRGWGLIRLRHGQASRVSTSNGLPTDTLRGLMDDGRGCLWIGSNRGIIRARFEDLHAVADGRERDLFCQTYAETDGLATAECASTFQPSAARDANGRLWFATLKGVSVVDPARITINTNPPTVIVETLLVDGRPARVAPADFSVGRGMSLPPGTKRVEVRFTSPSFVAPEKLRFRYIYGRKGNDWNDIGDRRVIYLENPEPGLHQFRIRAANNDGVWSASPATVAFTVAPFFWQTMWFRSLALLGLIGGGGGIAWLVSRRRVRSEWVKLEQERRVTELERRFSAIAENTSDVFCLTDIDGRILHLNGAGRRLLELPAEEDASRRRLSELQPPWAVILIRDEGIKTALHAGSWQGETALVSRSGQEIPVSHVIAVQRGLEGTVESLSHVLRDISARKRSEEALRSSEGLLRSILDSSDSIIWVKDLKGRFVLVNRLFEKMQGLSRDQLLGRTVHELFPPDLAESYTQNDQRVLAEGRLMQFDEVVRIASGERAILAAKFPLRDATGQVSGLGAICTDVTASRAAQVALQASEERFRAVAVFSPMGMHFWGLEPDGRLLLVGANPAADRILSVRHADLVGLPIEEAFPALKDTPIPQRYRDICHGGAPWETEQLDYADERIRGAYEVHVFAVGSGRLVAMFADITRRKQFEQALRDSEERFRTLTQLLPQTVYETDLSGRLLFSNEAGFRCFGYGQEDLDHGLNALDMLDAADRERAQANIRRILAGGETGPGQYLGRRKDGSTFPVIMQSSVILKDRKPVGLRGIIFDVSDVRRAEEIQKGLGLLAQALTAPLTLNELGTVVGQECQRLFRHDAFFFELLRDAAGGTSLLHAEDTPPGGASPVPITTTRPQIDRDLLVAMNEGRPVLINRTTEAELAGRPAWGYTERRSMSLIFAPILWERRCIGILSVQAYVSGRFTDRDVETLQFVANQCAPATLRIQAEQQLRQWNQELEDRVRERTDELQRVVNLMAGREVRMSELKDRIRQLEDSLRAAGVSPPGASPG